MDISSLLPADATDEVLIYILRSLNHGDLPDSMSGQTESSIWASSRNESQTTECIACNNQFPPLALFKPSCSHEYCRACLVGLVRSSLQDESLFPPKCCGQTIPIKQGRWFSPQLVGQFQAKKLEFDTPNRTYCSEPSCSTFIPPVFIAGSHHTGVCPSDTASQQFLQLAVQNGWQQCYSCHRVVELDTGCYHMRPSSAIFVANTVVDRDDNADRMDAAMRQAHVEEERVNLMENHECPHRVWGLRAGDHQLSYHGLSALWL
uniref:RING-type domain-containing protein n=1 Tax=Gibberella zeae TaxID=5518 RepID=A0A4E9E185_GIBZA